MIGFIMRGWRLPARALNGRLAVFAALVFLAAGLMGASSPEGGRKKYGPFVRVAAEKHGLDENLIHSIIQVESNYNPAAVSVKGAVGLMQLVPETASQYGVQNVFDPQQNIDGGVRYLKDLFSRYRNDLRTVLAAYNAGPDAVKKHKGVPPFPETLRYIRKVLSVYNGRGGTGGGQLYSLRDARGKILLTSDRFYLSLRRDAPSER